LLTAKLIVMHTTQVFFNTIRS